MVIDKRYLHYILLVEILRGVYPEQCEILRYAQNDKEGLRNDKERLRMTRKGSE